MNCPERHEFFSPASAPQRARSQTRPPATPSRRHGDRRARGASALVGPRAAHEQADGRPAGQSHKHRGWDKPERMVKLGQ